jgi:hypothetical protein
MMTRFLLAAAALLASLQAALAQDKPKPPAGPSPLLIVISNADKAAGKITYQNMVYVTVAKEVEDTVVVDGKQVKVKRVVYETVPTMTEAAIAVKMGMALDTGGKALDEDTVWKALTRGAVVVVSQDGKMVEPAYLSVFKKETVVLVPPLPKLVPPMPLPPMPLPPLPN